MFLILGFSVSFEIYFLCYHNRRICKFQELPEALTIDTIKWGLFEEYIPQTGNVEIDSSINGMLSVIVEIDELYLTKISQGLKATAVWKDEEYKLTIARVHRKVVNGRFHVDMDFDESPPPDISDGKSLRLRIVLTEPCHRILLPMGSFYMDTGGEWVFVVDGNRVVRRNVDLGGRMGSEYFEVVTGLRPGERVITSHYGPLKSWNSLDISAFQKLYDNSFRGQMIRWLTGHR